MQKRLFVAINLPEDVKKRLFRFVGKECKNLPVKWSRRENLHLTLNFLGYIPEESILEICDTIREISENFPSFDLGFKKIEIGPDKERKKMIWISGEKNEDLSRLRHRLDRALGFHVGERKKFSPHITLGRIIKKEWDKIRPQPDVDKSFMFSIPVISVDLFESKFEKGKRVYYTMESFGLK